MAKFYDVSLSIQPGMPVWPGDPLVSLDLISRIEDGENANVSRMSMGVHTGTHVDAPFHFVAGAATVESLALDVLIGIAQVIEIDRAVGQITADVLRGATINPGVRRVLFKTRNSDLWARGETRFQKDFVALSEDAALFLVDAGIQLVGIDYLSIAPFDAGVPTHVALLTRGVVIVEGVNLAEVPAGMYRMICLPMKLKAADGAPARMVLEAM
ncbi:hypothetical protein ADN00_08100 [Ornatilinea apprima]|uniref:Kynurenine formamidase n=1 Tax=Ornatilinea apprima TaxID=1134406 RepID=A0A0P6XC63_9CHLR|nr:cyclase family protein [Ornatilinea apprima]KPL77837.1 hypothetical protein ADN00_08100 [Ornatilinea apprima]